MPRTVNGAGQPVPSGGVRTLNNLGIASANLSRPRLTFSGFFSSPLRVTTTSRSRPGKLFGLLWRWNETRTTSIESRTIRRRVCRTAWRRIAPIDTRRAQEIAIHIAL